MTSIKNLRQRISQCNECPLFADLLCLPNIGYGSSSPDILFITGGIDKDNAIFGKPLSVQAEMVLLKSLEKSGINAGQCYITSIVKCGANLSVKKSHIATCSKWLIEEINLLQPKVLFFLGQKTFDIFHKLYGVTQIKTFTEPSTLNGIFNKNSLMNGFVDRLKEIKNFITERTN